MTNKHTSFEKYTSHFPNKCPRYDSKQSDGQASVMLELWGMRSTLLLPLLWHGVVAPDRILPMSQIVLNCMLILNWIVWNRTVLKFNYV